MNDAEELDEARRIVLKAARKLIDELGLEPNLAAQALIAGGLFLLEESSCEHTIDEELAYVTSAVERLRSGGGLN